MDYQTYQYTIIERRGHVGILTINRPEKLNAINPQLLMDFRNAMLELNGDKEVRAACAGRARELECPAHDRLRPDRLCDDRRRVDDEDVERQPGGLPGRLSWLRPRSCASRVPSSVPVEVAPRVSGQAAWRHGATRPNHSLFYTTSLASIQLKTAPIPKAGMRPNTARTRMERRALL